MGVPEPVIRQDPTGITYTLYYSTDSGDANLTVGFYLVGPPNIIEYVKTWKFGDGDIETDHSIVQNHMYGPTAAPGVNGSVTVNDPNTGSQIVEIPFQITITNRKVLYISNFYQTEGAIIEGSSVGFAIALTRITTTPATPLTWDYGNGGPQVSGPSETNPSLKYPKSQYYPPYQGAVNLFDSGHNSIDNWNFSVMILPSLIEYVGWIDFFSDYGNKTAKVKVGSSVSFEVEVSGGLPFGDVSYKWDVQAKSLDVITPPAIPSSGPDAQCTFPKSATYQVRCMISQTSSASPEPFLIVSTYVYAENNEV